MGTRSVGTAAVVGIVAVLGGSLGRAPVSRAAEESQATSQQAFRIAEPVRDSVNALAKLLSGASPSSPDDKRRRVEQLLEAVNAVAALVPRETFDIDAVAAAAGPEPEALHRWVRERTTWVPYRGLLRGARGTLMDRVGNSLDRSLLLAALLASAGATVQLAHAELPEKVARSLRDDARTATATPESAAPEDAAALNSALGAYVTAIGVDPADLVRLLKGSGSAGLRAETDVKRRVAAQVTRLAQAVGRPVNSAVDPSVHELDVIRDHWWVRVQRDEKWIDLDPMLGDPGRALAQPATTLAPEDLDAELHHTVDVRIVIEKWNGSNFQEAQPVSITLRPSEILGETLMVRHVPMAWSRDLAPGDNPQRKFRDTALTQREWAPVLTIGSRRVVQASVLDTGDLGSGQRKPAAGGIFGAVGGGDAPGTGVLTAEWIEYEIRSPGRASRIVRRQLFDLVGLENRAARRGPSKLSEPERLTRAFSLLGETEILPLASQLSPAFVAHQTATRMVDNAPILETLAFATDKPSGQPLHDHVGQIQPGPGLLHALAVSRGQWQRAPGGVYLSQPNVLSLHVFPREGPGGTLDLVTAFDIVSNEVSARLGTPDERFLSRLEQGVLDTNAEAVLVGPSTAGSTTADAYELDQSGAGWVLLRSAAELERFTPPPDIRRRLEADIRAGYVVVAPQGAGTTAPMTWWRVHPETGDTLGYGINGWGQATAEYVAAGFAYGFSVCLFYSWLGSTAATPTRIAPCIVAGGAGAAIPIITGGFLITGLVVLVLSLVVFALMVFS
jgi:hypothetical protein